MVTSLRYAEPEEPREKYAKQSEEDLEVEGDPESSCNSEAE